MHMCINNQAATDDKQCGSQEELNVSIESGKPNKLLVSFD